MLKKSCAWVERNLAAYLHHDLPSAQQQALQEHLQACPACAQKLAALQGLHQRLSAERPAPASLSAPARQRVSERVQQRMRNGTMQRTALKLAGEVYQLAALAATFLVIIVSVALITRLRPQAGDPSAPTRTPESTLAASPLPSGTPTTLPTRGTEVTVIFAAPQYQVVEEFARLAEEFHAQHPNITVEIVPTEKLVLDDYENAIARLVTNADAAYWWVDPASAAKGLLRDLSPFIQATPDFQAQDFYPGSLESYQWAGGTWGLPGAISLEFVFYDQEKLEQAGLTPPALEWNQADFLQTAQALTRRSGQEVSQYGFVNLNGQAGLGMLETNLLQAQATGRVDTPEMAAALRWLSDLELVYQVSPVLPGGNEGLQQARNLIEHRQAGMWSDSLYNYQYYTSQAGWRLGLALFPSASGVYATANSYGYLMSAGTSHPAETWLWMNFLSHQRLQAGAPPDATLALPARRSVAEQSGYWEQFDAQVRPVVAYAAEHLAFAPFDPASSYLHVWQALQAVRGGQSAETALAAAQQAYLQDQERVRQIEPTPVVMITPGPRPGATQINFLPGGTYLELLYGLVERFEQQHPDIQVEILEYDQPDKADCLASANLIRDTHDLTHLLQAEPDLAQAYVPAVLQAHQPYGRLFSLPMQVMPRMIHYNKALFDAAGLAYPSQDWTMADFLAAAQALTNDSGQYGYVSQLGEGGDLAAFVAAQGVQLWDENGQPRFTQPEVAAAVQWYTDLALKYRVMPLFDDSRKGQLSSEGIDQRNKLIQGQQAAMWAEFFPYNAAAEVLTADQMGWAPWPQGSQAATVIFYDGLSIAANAAPAQAQACWQWIKYLSGQPEAIDSISPRLDVLNSPEYLAPSSYQVPRRAEDLPLQRYVLETYSDAYAYHNTDINVTPVLDMLLVDIYNGMPVAEALAKAQQQYLLATPTPPMPVP